MTGKKRSASSHVCISILYVHVVELLIIFLCVDTKKKAGNAKTCTDVGSGVSDSEAAPAGMLQPSILSFNSLTTFTELFQRKKRG
jgi:hypothetical protein